MNRLRTPALHLSMLSFNAGATIVFEPIEKLQLLNIVLNFISFVTFSMSMNFLLAQYQKFTQSSYRRSAEAQ